MIPSAPAIGERLRHRRVELGLTLKDVARGAGLSTGFISQVERDLVAPSLSSLAAMARILDVPLAQLLPDVRGSARTTSMQRPIHKVGTEPHLGYERLTTSFAGSVLNGVIIHEEPGHWSEPIRHEGEEMFFVLEGAITVEVEGDRTVLNAGDSLHFSSRRRHSTWNHGTTAATILHVCTMDVFGDRIPAETSPGHQVGHQDQEEDTE
ncbi:helix-turn-helix domain-containing protein [Rubellimicrobium arenae]|uniref:helix-turn-helix domain-containing protein n=1 Tax=Rubellimicrobium arenae TaxID=2817372 RepID=UPI001B316BE2|nr:cupin domain-containing protein [Rubellimicrobium arenae]